MSGFTFGTGGTGGFSFSTPATTASTGLQGFSFSKPAATATTSVPTLSGGLFSTAAASTTSSAPVLQGFSFSSTTSTAASTTAGSIAFSLTKPAATAATSGSLFGISSTTSAQATTSTTFASPFASSTFSTSTTTTTTAATGTGTSGFSFLGGTTTAAALGTSTTTTLGLTTSLAPTVAPTSTSASTAAVAAAPSLCTRDLEEKVNRWLVELQEQEERFLRQAAHVNQWDQVLQKGHDQVAQLKETMNTLKSDQSRLEAELDFIKGQQDELERLIEPVETAVATSDSTKQLHQGDRQRDSMYHLAQNLDTELRQMTTDLTKVIEHLNTFSGPGQTNDPVAQVGRIISAHMDTLRWVDQNSTLLSGKLDELSKSIGGNL